MSEATAVAEDTEDVETERMLRPDALAGFVGQGKVRGQLQVMLDAARMDGRTPEHVLFAGPPGLGKTTLAMIVARESGGTLRMASGPALQSAADLAGILCGLVARDVLFIDEIHRVGKTALEVLYMAMEDSRVDLMVGHGKDAVAVPVDLPPFTLAGATTMPGMLPQPMQDRFGLIGQLDYYSVDELGQVLQQSAAAMGVEMSDAAREELARCGRGTPRVVNRLLRRVRDYARVYAVGIIDQATVRSALALYDVDEAGLDRTDRAVLEALTGRYRGRAVGVSALAMSIGAQPDTITGAVEPYLVRVGMIERTPQGRMATRAAYEHMGVKIPPTALIR